MATLFSFLAWRIPRDRGAQRATVYGVPKSQTRLKYLSTRAQPAVGWCGCVCVRSGWGGWLLKSVCPLGRNERLLQEP